MGGVPRLCRCGIGYIWQENQPLGENTKSHNSLSCNDAGGGTRTPDHADYDSAALTD